MRCAITGASGLLGANLALELISAGHEVVCIRRGSSRVDHLAFAPITWVSGDLSDQVSLTRAFAGCEVVFHCAAQIEFFRSVSPSMYDTNVEGTRRVILAGAEAGVRRVVHCSSVVAIAIAAPGQEAVETTPYNLPQHGLDDSYTITKYQAQQVALELARQHDVVIVNPTFMFGPHDIRPSSGRLMVDLVKGKIPGYTSGVNNFVDARDVARGMIAAAEKGRRGELYILGGRNMSYQEIFKAIARVAGVKAPWVAIPRFAAELAGWCGEILQRITGKEAPLNISQVRWSYCQDYRFNHQKVIQELGYTTRPLEETLTDTLVWFRQQGLLPLP